MMCSTALLHILLYLFIIINRRSTALFLMPSEADLAPRKRVTCSLTACPPTLAFRYFAVWRFSVGFNLEFHFTCSRFLPVGPFSLADSDIGLSPTPRAKIRRRFPLTRDLELLCIFFWRRAGRIRREVQQHHLQNNDQWCGLVILQLILPNSHPISFYKKVVQRSGKKGFTPRKREYALR